MGDMQNIFVFQAVDYMSNNLAERLKKIFSPGGLDLSTTDKVRILEMICSINTEAAFCESGKSVIVAPV